MVTGIVEIPDIDDPDKNADSCNDLGQDISKLVDLLLERCLFGDLGGDGSVDVAESGECPRGRDNGFTRAIDNGSSLYRDAVSIL